MVANKVVANGKAAHKEVTVTSIMFKDRKVTRVMHSHKAAIIIAVVTIICLLPFANKAFHIDDPLFIWTAKHIKVNPLNFYGFNVNWYGMEMPMAEVTKNPPVACYYIALVGWLFGWDEITLHTAFLIPAVAAALGTYYLARKFCSQPILAALAAVLTPGFLVSSNNVMCDTIMLAFWVWAVYFWVRGIEANKCLSLFFAAVLVALCALTKYFGMALLPLLLVYSLMKKRRIGIWVLFLLIPVVVLAEYQWLTHNLYDRGLLADAASYATERSWAQVSKLLSQGLIGLFFTGGCVVTALFYSPLLWSKRILAGGIVLTIILILTLSCVEKIGIVPIRGDDGVRWSFLIQVGLMTAAGICILALAGADFWKSRDAESLLLLLWVYGTLIFAGFINWTVNARSILPMTPAVGILLMRRIDRYSDKTTRRTGTLWRSGWPLVPAALVAILVCWADYTLAASARSAAAAMGERFENSQQTVWFQGHWGFQYYMELAGGKAVDFTHPEVAHGDIIIVPSNNTNIKPLPQESVHLNYVFRFAPYRKLATMNPQLGAGFYADIWGPLPFVAGPVAPERYYAYIVLNSLH